MTTPMTTPKRTPVDAQALRAYIAHTILGHHHEPQIGEITLLPHQVDAVHRVRAALREHHVALLADDVGMGKTFTALAVAREHPHVHARVHVIAPATLLPMWHDAIRRTATRNVNVVSVHRFSRRGLALPKAAAGDLCIIDEAHYVRTPGTQRYRAVAEFVAGCDLLLLSATPVHNRAGDLRALLALALGERGDLLAPTTLAHVVVRRSTQASRPQVRRMPPTAIQHDTALLDELLALPAPLPAHDGAAAGALIRLGLLRAWCSSDAALEQSLRRRLLRGEALHDALLTGRHPTQRELQSWVLGDDTLQLAFPELMASQQVENGPLLDVLSRHLRAVRALLARHRDTSDHDAQRAAALRAVLHEHPDTPIVAFTQFAETVRALSRALADIAGVGALTGQRAWIASGTITREDAITSFAPRAHGRPPPPAHHRIRLLLTTDILAEGVNLQDAGVVVHLDLPWTPALARQRVGRCVRLGSPHAEVIVYRFAPHDGADRILGTLKRLRRKSRVAAQYLGARSAGGSTAPRRACTISVAEAATRVRAMLQRWGEHETITITSNAHEPTPFVACALSARAGFLAMVRRGDGGSELLAGLWRATAHSDQPRLRISSSPRALWRVMRSASRPGTNVAVDASRLAGIERVVDRALHRRSLRKELEMSAIVESDSVRAARVMMIRTLADQSTVERLRLRAAWIAARAMLDRVRGAAAESALRSWMAECAPRSVDAWLVRWDSYPALCDATPAQSPPQSQSQSPSATTIAGRCVAVLVLHRASFPA